MDIEAFRKLVAEVRAGNQAAAAQLVREYEPELRRVIRIRLTDPRLRRLEDTGDVCQSVLANFFVRVTAGEFDLDQPEQLMGLLFRMAKNKIIDKARRQDRDKRDQRRISARSEEELDRIPGQARDPASIVIHQDLLEKVRGLLDGEERYLADQRGLGREWSDLAGELGVQPDALRKKLSRALDRVMIELGLEES